MSTVNKNILCIGFPAWEGDYLKSTILLIKELARIHTVLYVEYPFTIKDVILGLLRLRIVPVLRILGIRKRLRKISVSNAIQLYVLTLPPMLPVNWVTSLKMYEIIMRVNAMMSRSIINRMLKKINMKNPIVINAFNPTLGNRLINAFNERALLYYCYDEISQAKWAKKHGPREELKFLSKVDGVVVSSEGLFVSKSKLNSNCYLIKNGVDTRIFLKSYSLRKLRNKSQKKTIIGYLGSFDLRIDIKLLEFLAFKNPSFQFQIVGRIVNPQACSDLKNYPNIIFTGSRTQEDIPKQVASFDLGIIPFVKNEFTSNIYPLKINEYLAAGLPVVSTNFAPLDEFEDIISIAPTYEKFHYLISNELKNDSSEKELRRIERANQNTWKSRANQFNQIVDQMRN